MPTQSQEGEKERIRTACRLLYRASRHVRVLKAIEWPADVKDRFFADGATQLPRVDYQPSDPTPAIEAVREARRSITPVGPIGAWLTGQADTIERSARMMAAVGTASFFDHGKEIYGEPTSPLRLYSITPLELAQSVRDSIEQLARIQIEIAPPAYHDAEEVARDIERAVQSHFGADAPPVKLVERLSAKALASTKAILVRRDARFTDRDASQLLNHEAYVHYATSWNGRAQTDLPILAAGHPGTTRTQDGLAVCAEISSGSMELDRLRRLADRVFAIQMAVEGADFLQVYRYFLEHGIDEAQAFDNAQRVFRGGVMSGGAPFTKDVVYLYGLLAVGNTIRATFAAGRSDCLRLLFCGKLDVLDIPALCELHVLGLLRPPKHLPPWVSDPRYLLALLTYSTFINKMNLRPVQEFAERLLADAPLVKL